MILKKTVILIATAAVMLFNSVTAMAVHADDPRPDFNIEVNAPTNIVFMGDSITTGYGLDGYTVEDKSKCASYANLLTAVFDSELPEAAGFTSSNVAKDGMTSKKLLKNLKDGLYDKELKNADAVVMSIGGNDLMKPILKMIRGEYGFSELIDQIISLDTTLEDNLDAFSENLADIMKEINDRNDCDDLALFVHTLYNPLEGHQLSALDDLAQEKIDELNEIIIDNAGKLGYTVVDVSAAFKGENASLTNIDSMDIHPNADGHSRIAKTLQPIIEKRTYTYFDAEAEMQYEIELMAKRQEEREKKKKIYSGMAVGTAACAVAVASFTFVNAVRKNR